MRSAIGDEKGSSSDGYAAVFGRCDFGSESRNFANDVAAVDDRRRLREEDVVELLVEHRRAAARRLDERVAVAVGDRGGRAPSEQRRERAEDEVDVVLR